MALQPPPSISPRQMNLLRIVVSMAWSDGHLAAEEMNVMLDRFSSLFANEPSLQQLMQQELREYMVQNLPLDELIKKLETDEERELVLKLGHEVIHASARTPQEPKVNEEEAAAYRKLVQLLNLPPDVVSKVEAESNSAADSSEGLVDKVVHQMNQFLHN